jgi:predicted secreted protein
MKRVPAISRIVLSLLAASLLLCGCDVTTPEEANNSQNGSNNTDTTDNTVTTDNTLDPALSEKIDASIELFEGQENVVSVGQTMRIELDEQQSIPLRWQFALSNESIITLFYDLGETVGNLSDPPMPGGDTGRHTFYFEALAPGECTIEMRYLSVDATFDGEAMEVASFTVKVQ